MNSSNTGGTLGPLVSTGFSLAAGFDGREDLEERASKEGETELSEKSYIHLVLVNVIVGCWLIYTIYFNSRVFGFIISAIVSKTTKMDFDLGSFSVSVLSGKIMFKGLYVATTDFSISIYDGIITFRWWKMFDLEYYQEKAPRLVLDLTTVDIHVYNRCQLYEELAQSFADTKTRQLNIILERRRNEAMVGSTKSESTLRNTYTPNAQAGAGNTIPRKRNTRTVSSRSSGSDSSHAQRIGVLSPEAQTVLSGPGGPGGGASTGFSGSSMSTGAQTTVPNVDDRRSQASKLGSDVERGSHPAESTSNTNSQKATDTLGMRIWNAFKDLLAIIQIRACPVSS